jgi:hypothetical protein
MVRRPVVVEQEVPSRFIALLTLISFIAYCGIVRKFANKRQLFQQLSGLGEGETE